MSPLRETLTDAVEDNLHNVIVDGGNVLPLTHSVSFYRKQQAQVSNHCYSLTIQLLRKDYI